MNTRRAVNCSPGRYGRLSGSEPDWLEAHLEGCRDCRRELPAAGHPDAIAREPTVEFAPQASFNRLWARIEPGPPRGPATGAGSHGCRQARAPQALAAAGGRVRRWPYRPCSSHCSEARYGAARQSIGPDYRTVTRRRPARRSGNRHQGDLRRSGAPRRFQDILAGAGLAVASGLPPRASTPGAVDAKATPLAPSTIARLRADHGSLRRSRRAVRCGPGLQLAARL